MRKTNITRLDVLFLMTYGKRLNAALIHAGKSRKALADFLGCTPQAIGIVITWIGEKDRKLGTESHAGAAKFLNVDSHWLATGEGKMVGYMEQSSEFDEWQDKQPKGATTAYPANAMIRIPSADSVATLEQSLEGMATYLAGLDESDRREAMKMIGGLAESPERHAKTAAGIKAMVGTPFAKSGKKQA